MDFHTINPGHFRAPTLLKLGTEDIHELARKAVAVLTTYRLVVGRCLLAMHESKGCKKHGCSSAIHYACAVLGMSASSARECRRVARALQELPELTLTAEHGTVEWSKLREIVRRAVPETQEYWLRLCRKHSYREIEVLVSRAPTGSLPGEVDTDGDSYRSELRCSAGPRLFAMLDRVRRVMSEEREEALTTAEVLEMGLASMMAGGSFESDALKKAHESVDKDLLAEKARLLPVAAEARELAVEMGLLEAESLETEGLDDEANDDGDAECSARNTSARVPSFGNWKNRHLRFNRRSRFATRAQRQELLRRDGWACRTPGCPNR